MNRASILSRLLAAEEHVWSCERQITNRRDFILSLKCAGCDTTTEVELLREMEDEQTEYVAERDRLQAKLAVLNDVEAAQTQLPFWAYGTS